MKKLHYLFLLLLVPLVSCTKYELEGSIDNPKFIGSWGYSSGDGTNNVIKINGDGTFEKFNYAPDNSRARDNTSKGKIIIEGNRVTRETYNRFKENSITRWHLFVLPTEADTFYITNGGEDTVRCVAYIERLTLLAGQDTPKYSFGIPMFKIAE